MRRISFALAVAASVAAVACRSSRSDGGRGAAAANESTTLAAPAPLPPLPSGDQVAWQARGPNAFVHFNMNTFTAKEWGEGREAPSTFAPTALDCRQWARVFRDAGFAGVVLTAKHHDGFCLWPSRTTEHTVAHSAWRDGHGDVLRELSDACRESGLRFGVYLSPWDRNHPAYGDSDRYNAIFRAQLTEVLSNYGPVSEVWFDGACGEGPNGKRQVYDWPSFVRVVRDLQPHAVIFSDAGPDIRWVGNEDGIASETCWSMLRRDEFYPGTPNSAPLGPGQIDGTHWVPPECDVSIRRGWYWKATEDGTVKSVDDLEALWLASIGRNANLLLNVPADTRGLIPDHEADVLRKWRARLDATFAVDLARRARVSAGNVRGATAAAPGSKAAAPGSIDAFGPERAIDGDPATFWAADDGVTATDLTLAFDGPTIFDRVDLRERIELGQRVRAFRVDVDDSGGWREIAHGTTIGARRVLVVPRTTARQVRLSILDARAAPTLTTFGLFATPESK